MHHWTSCPTYAPLHQDINAFFDSCDECVEGVDDYVMTPKQAHRALAFLQLHWSLDADIAGQAQELWHCLPYQQKQQIKAFCVRGVSRCTSFDGNGEHIPWHAWHQS